MEHRRIWASATFMILGCAGCSQDFDTTRNSPDRPSFGAILYQEGCARVAYTSELDEQAAGKRDTVDVDGTKYQPLCTNTGPAPDGATAKVIALSKQRPLIVPAVDAITPKSFLKSLESFLEAIVGLYDNDAKTMTSVMQETIVKMANLVGILHDDPDFAPALARFSPRIGYRPTATAAGIVPAVVRYPQIDAMTTQLLNLIGDGGPAHGEFRALLDAISHELRAAQPVMAPNDSERTLRVALNLLTQTDPSFGDGTPRLLTVRDWRGFAALGAPSVSAPFVDANHDGLPDVDAAGHFLGGSGKPLLLGSPFPAPGVTDTATRDMQGRLLGTDTKPLFLSLDLDPTLLDGALHEASNLLDPAQDNLLGLLYGASSLLGPRMMTQKQYPSLAGAGGGGGASFNYNGFSTDKSALLDLTHAFLQLLDDPNAEDTFLVAKTLLTSNEEPTARAIAAMFDANDRGKLHPEASIPATSTLYDEMMPIVIRILRVPGLMADLLDATQDPHVKGLGASLASQMIYKDRFVLNQGDLSVQGSFSTMVDRGQPDSDFNRSVMQRMAHLVHDANGIPFCNKDGAQIKVAGIKLLGPYKKCEMFNINDLGLFFVLTMADRNYIASTKTTRYDTTYSKASFFESLSSSLQSTMNFLEGSGFLLLPFCGATTIDKYLECETGISGFGKLPTSQAGARSLFIDPAHQTDFLKNTTDPVQCSDDDRFIDVHQDSIFAWEKPFPNNPGVAGDSFYDAVRPLITAFAKHDECLAYDDKHNCAKAQNAAKIFVDLMSVLHVHWSSPKSTYFGHAFQSLSPGKTRYSTGDAVVTYEPLVAEVLGKGDLYPAILNFTGVLNTMSYPAAAGSAPARPVLLKTAGYLLDPSVTPSGVAYRSGSTMALKSDGTSPAGRVTPYYLIADAFAAKRAQLAAAPPNQAGSWRSAASKLVDQLLTVDTMPDGKHQFHNRRFPPLSAILLDFLRGRLEAHRAAGDLDAWVNTNLTSDIARAIGGPVMASLADLTARIEEHPPMRDAVYGLLGYLIDPKSQSAFTTLLTGVGDLLQLLLDDPDVIPVQHTIGTAIDPAQGVIDAQLHLMDRSRALDPNCPANKGTECTLMTLVRNLFAETARGVSPASDVADALAEINRVQPGVGTDLNADDFKSIFDNVKIFLNDKQHGFLRFVEIVQSRTSPPVDSTP